MATLDKLKDWTCVGVIIGPHGLTGGLKIKSFCENPSAIKNYNPLKVEGYPGTMSFKIVSNQNDTFKVKSETIRDRDSALALKGKLLFASRNKLPNTENGEYYFTDLIGLNVKNTDSVTFGKIKNVENYGAGTFLEVVHNITFQTVFVPFSKEFIPTINLDKKYIILKEFPTEFSKEPN